MAASYGIQKRRKEATWCIKQNGWHPIRKEVAWKWLQYNMHGIHKQLRKEDTCKQNGWDPIGVHDFKWVLFKLEASHSLCKWLFSLFLYRCHACCIAAIFKQFLRCQPFYLMHQVASFLLFGMPYDAAIWTSSDFSSSGFFHSIPDILFAVSSDISLWIPVNLFILPELLKLGLHSWLATYY